MGRTFQGIGIAIAAVALLTAMSSPSVAQTPEPVGISTKTTTVLPANESLAYVASLATLDSLRFSVVVIVGSAVDVYLVDATGYRNYTEPGMEDVPYYEAWTRRNTSSFAATFTASRDAAFYLIVDNTPKTAGGAPGLEAATVTITVEVLRFLTSLAVAVVLGVALASVAIVLYLRLKRALRETWWPVTSDRMPSTSSRRPLRRRRGEK